jgi:hypothetical protein
VHPHPRAFDNVSHVRQALGREKEAPTPLAVGKFQHDLDGTLIRAIQFVFDAVGSDGRSHGPVLLHNGSTFSGRQWEPSPAGRNACR